MRKVIIALLFTIIPITAFGAGDLYLDDGTPVPYATDPINFTNTHDEAYSSLNKISIYNIDTDTCVGQLTADNGDVTNYGVTSTVPGDYSVVGVYDGDTTNCWDCSKSYTNCVTATFYDEYVFEILNDPSSTPTSTMTQYESFVSYQLVFLLIILGAFIAYSILK